jgi:hypothetical protein
MEKAACAGLGSVHGHLAGGVAVVAPAVEGQAGIGGGGEGHGDTGIVLLTAIGSAGDAGRSAGH